MKGKVAILLVAVSFIFCQTALAAGTFNMVIMASKDPRVEGPKYGALSRYIESKSKDFPKIKLKIAKDYPDAVSLFQSGKVDGMFSGSFVAAVFIGKDVAKPAVRPLSTSGVSTYKALVAAKKGTADFKGINDFKGKKVAYCSLASSGEIFARSLLNAGETPEKYYTPVIAKSHQIALNAVQSGAADYAVFKNLVWDPRKYSDLVVVGGDSAENPNNSLILTNSTFERYGDELVTILTGLENDNSDLALKLKKAFGVKSFIATSEQDFEHTYSIVEKASVNPQSFNFSF